MSFSVFGTPVTDAMLKEIPDYKHKCKCSISQKDRAMVALEKANEEDKVKAARDFLEKLQDRFQGDDLSTMCMIYNATGGTMTLVDSCSFEGRVCESPYPRVIANGQWGVYLHGQCCGSGNISKNCIVYSALNNQGIKKHWIIGFSNNRVSNKVYAEIRNPDDVKWVSQAYSKLIDDSSSIWKEKNESGCYLNVAIGNSPKSVFEAFMTLPEAI